LGLDEWILPAFAIPIRNPAFANVEVGLESGSGSPAAGQNWREGIELMEIVIFPRRDAGECGIWFGKRKETRKSQGGIDALFWPRGGIGP